METGRGDAAATDDGEDRAARETVDRRPAAIVRPPDPFAPRLGRRPRRARAQASPPKVPHNRFLAALAVYSAPLVYALLTDDVSSDDPFLEADVSVGGLAAFVALAALLYAAQRGLAAAGRWKFNEKTAADRKEDLLRQSLLCGLAYGGGAIGARLAARPLGFAALVAASRGRAEK